MYGPGFLVRSSAVVLAILLFVEVGLSGPDMGIVVFGVPREGLPDGTWELQYWLGIVVFVFGVPCQTRCFQTRCFSGVSIPRILGP